MPLLYSWSSCGWNEHEICLPTGVLGTSSGIRFEPVEVFDTCGDETVRIDGVSIEPASDRCPRGSSLLDSDFDQPSAWQTEGDATVAGGEGELVASCQRAELHTQASIHPNSMVHLLVDGDAGTSLTVEVNGMPVGTLPATGTPTHVGACLPSWAWGQVVDLGIVAEASDDCESEVPFVVDEAMILITGQCQGQPDGGFETLDGWALTASPGATIGRTTDPARVHTGNGALAFDAQASCATGVAKIALPVPEARDDLRPALRYRYRVDGQGTVDIVPGVEGASAGPGWQEALTCLPDYPAGWPGVPTRDGMVREIALGIETACGGPGAGGLQVSLDDVRVELVSGCNMETGQPGLGSIGSSMIMCGPPTPIDLHFD